MRTKIWLFGILGMLAVWSCDTASSIDPPENSFFVKFYGANGNQEGVDAVLNADGTITLFGTTEVGGIKQLYLVNIDQNGTVIWENTIVTPTAATAKDIELTNDGRLAIVADVKDGSGTNDVLIMTLTLTGVEIVRDTVSFKISGQDTDEVANSITQTSDGFIVSGSTSNTELDPQTGDIRDAMLLRFSDNLVELTPLMGSWGQTSGQGLEDIATKTFLISIPSRPEVESIIFGSTDLGGNFNFYFDPIGYFGESTNPIVINVATTSEILTSAISVPVQSGDGYLLGGVSKSATSTDIFIVKLRKSLELQFQKTLSVDLGPTSADMVTVYAPSTSGFLILANDKSSGVQNFYLNKIDNGGSVVWPNPIIFGGELDDEVGAVMELPDGSIGIIGTFAIGADGEKKMTFIKVNKEGKFSK